MRFFFPRRQNGECEQQGVQVFSIDDIVTKARNEYQQAVSRLALLEASFEATDFTDVPVDIFQAKETEIRLQKNVVETKRSQMMEMEATQAKQIEIREREFVQEQKKLRLAEIERELDRLSAEIPRLQVLLNTLPMEVEQLRQRSMSLQREHAQLVTGILV